MIISLRHASCGYGGPPVIEDVTLHVDADDFVGIVGPSGSGKTTVLRTMLGAVRPVFGDVIRAPDLRVAYVPQVETVDWNFPVTVAEVAAMGLVRARRSPRLRPDEREAVAGVLDRLGIGSLARRHIRELSGGQQQRAFLARALIQRPGLLVLDEPTMGVDARTRHDVLHLLGDLNADGVAIVLTTHDLNGLAAHLPRLVCFNRTVIADGPPLEVLRPYVLERTFGAPMGVLLYEGIPIVVEHPHSHAHGSVRRSA